MKTLHHRAFWPWMSIKIVRWGKAMGTNVTTPGDEHRNGSHNLTLYIRVPHTFMRNLHDLELIIEHMAAAWHQAAERPYVKLRIGVHLSTVAMENQRYCMIQMQVWESRMFIEPALTRSSSPEFSQSINSCWAKYVCLPSICCPQGMQEHPRQNKSALQLAPFFGNLASAAAI